MGRIYLDEMDMLAQTLEWANNASVGELADVINKIGAQPFFTVGSGGSLAGAAYWPMVHEQMTGQPSKYGTPLEMLALPSVSPYAVGLMSAGGGNPDIVRSLTHAARDGSPGQYILTFAKASQLNEEAEGASETPEGHFHVRPAATTYRKTTSVFTGTTYSARPAIGIRQ